MTYFIILNAYLCTERSFTWFKSFRTSSMEGMRLLFNSLLSLVCCRPASVSFVWRCWISSNADAVSVEVVMQGGSGGGGGAGATLRGVEVRAGTEQGNINGEPGGFWDSVRPKTCSNVKLLNFLSSLHTFVLLKKSLKRSYPSMEQQ